MTKQKATILFTLALSWLHATENEKSIQQQHLSEMPMDKFVTTLNLDELSDLIITDTKVAQSKKSVTQKVEVIYDSEFDDFGYVRNLSTILKYSSGQFVNVLSRHDANWGSYAGLGPKYNSYMLNGLPIDSFADTLHIDPWAFEKIEVYRGPASVLYSNYLTMDFAGSQTPLVATTNFILKEQIDTPMTMFQSGFGSFDTKNLKMYHQSKKDNLSYFVGASLESSDYKQYGLPNSWLQTVEKPDYLNGKIYGRIINNFDKDGDKVSLFFHHSQNRGDIGRPNREFEHDYSTINLEYDNLISKNLSFSFKSGFRDYDREFENDDFPSSLVLMGISKTKQQIIPIDLSCNITHHEDNILTVGTDLQFAKYETFQDKTDVNRAKSKSNGFYIQEKMVLDRWVFRVGARYDTLEHEYSKLGGVVPLNKDANWEEWLWSVGVRYNGFENISFYANSGTSFTAPSAKQVGGTVLHAHDSGQIANPSLLAESGLGSDIGFEYLPFKDLTINTRIFLNKINDAIVDSVVSVSPSQTKSSNAGVIEAKGVEFDVRYKVSENLKTFFNLTLTDSTVKNPLTKDKSLETPFVVDVISNLGASFDLNGFLISPKLQIVGDYYDSTDKSSRSKFGSYEVVNLTVQKELTKLQGYQISGIAEINNLTNRKLELPWGFMEQKINGYAGVKVVF